MLLCQGGIPAIIWICGMVVTLHSATRWPGNGLLAHWSQLPAVSRILSHWKVRPPLSPVRLLHPVKVQGPQQRLVCPQSAPKSSGSTSSPIFYVNLYILYVYVYILCIFHVTEPRNRSTTLAASSYCFWESPSVHTAGDTNTLNMYRFFYLAEGSLMFQAKSLFLLYENEKQSLFPYILTEI